MSRIQLIIADKDSEYLSSLRDYLLANYGQTFDVITFSQEEYLQQYLAEQRGGILLVAPELQMDISQQVNLIQILLTAAPNSTDLKSGQIFKYQRGSELVQEILRQISEREQDFTVISAINKAKVVAAYSPAGGVGKTTVALGCALQTAWEGKRVFYLNLESLPSTGLFFEPMLKEGLATVLFCLQDKKKKPALKIKTLINIDPGSQIHYFSPTESGLELEAELGNNLALLVNLLKSSGDYDFIFLDLASPLNANNMSVLEASDVVLLLSTLEPACRIKVELFIQELKRWAARYNSTIMDRIYPLWNKWEEEAWRETDTLIAGLEPLAKIPFDDKLLLVQNSRYRLDLNGKFGTTLYQMRDSFRNMSRR